MNLQSDPVTASLIPEPEQQQDEQNWRDRTQAFVTSLGPAEPVTLCQEFYTFLDQQSRGQLGRRPTIPLCNHAPDSYLSDHALLTSAIAYCLGYGQVDIDLIRLAALSHEFFVAIPIASAEEARQALAAYFPPETRSFLMLAWQTLYYHGQQLADGLRSENSLSSFANARPDSSDERIQLLWYAHLAASARLHNAEFVDAEYEQIKTIAYAADFAQHPLKQVSTQVGLVYGGVTKVKQYVFESLRLPEIRGASSLLDRINRVDLLALWGWTPPALIESEYFGIADLCRAEDIRDEQIERCNEVRISFQQRYNLSPLMAPECIIYAGGGNVLALAPAQFVRPLADAIEWIYTDQTLMANSAAVGRTFSLLELQYGYHPEQFWWEEYQTAAAQPPTQALVASYYSYPDELRPKSTEGVFYARKTFGELVTVLATEFYQRRAGQGPETTLETLPRQYRALPYFELPPFAIKCYSCGARPAVLTVQDPNDVAAGQSPKVFCQACSRKRIVGQKAKQGLGERDWFVDPFDWQPQGVTAWEQEFSRFLVRQQTQSTTEGVDDLLVTYYARLPKAIRTQLKKLEVTETKRQGRPGDQTMGIGQLSKEEHTGLAQSATTVDEDRGSWARLLVEVEALQACKRNLLRPATTLGEIGAAARPERYVGLIYADGNNVGAQVARIATPAAYRQFAMRLEQANQTAVFTALAKHVQPHFLREAVDPDQPKRRQFWVHPFEIVTIGGDDVLLFVPGDKALAVVATMSQTLEELMGQQIEQNEKAPPRYAFQRFQPHSNDEAGWLRPDPEAAQYLARISASSGIVVAQEHTPVFFLVNLAENLQKSAKKMRKLLGSEPPAQVKRSWPRVEDDLTDLVERKVAWDNKRRGGTVDFLILKGMDMVTSNLDDFRARAHEREQFLGDPGKQPLHSQAKEKLTLTARPYTLLELKGLIQLARELTDVGFPASQQRMVERAIFQGRLPATVNYLYFYSRLRKQEFRQALELHFHRAWATLQNQLVTAPWRALTSADGSLGPHGKPEQCWHGEWETIWHDLMELAEFVEEAKEGEHASGAN